MTATILLVDDDPAVLDGLKRTLRAPDLTLLSALSAQEAVELLHQHRVDVVVSDDSMPGITGLDFLAQIRVLFPAILRIMLTGKATVERMAQALNEGLVFRFLSKPCPADVLAEAVRHAVEQKLLMDRGRDALALIRRHIAVLQYLEQNHPQVLTAALDAVAGLHIAPTDFVGATQLADEMDVQIKTLTGLHPAITLPVK